MEAAARRESSGRRHAVGLPVVAGWLIAAACFGFVAWRVRRAADLAGQDLPDYLADALRGVQWFPWLAAMALYSAAFVVLDAVLLTRVVSWSVLPVRVRDMLPLRAAAYVLSLVNEPVGKGAVALALHRRYRVPVTTAASPLVFVMVAEFVSLSLWALAGWTVGRERLPEAFSAVPWIAGLGLGAVAVGQFALRSTARGRALTARRRVLGAFGRATPRRYAEVVALRAPAMALAVGVYTAALHWFGVSVTVTETIGMLPAVLLAAAVPGPMRAVAIAAWVALFPDDPARAAAFGLLQHLTFLLFNALIGLAFLPAALRSGGAGSTPRAAPSTPPS
jgi:hypothetical protein